uniref:Uncharacterized protein n=1 Tax=Anguilla anguilla TaxID=7936 RepID=A0A0E9V1E7_ANGAN
MGVIRCVVRLHTQLARMTRGTSESK